MATEGQPKAPSAFGRYTLLERLAVGGMAEVFRAKITSSHGFEKILVIKRILPHLAADPNFVAMFIDEAKLTAQLTHPKIVQVLDFGEVSGQYFTALEFIDGFDALGLLRVAAQKRVHIPRSLAVFIVSEVLEALDYAHNARDMEGKPMQIVHRDISPSNIFISKRGDVKLGDFGIAHAQRRESKTQAGTLKGKYGYMSPEQVVGRPIDARSDLFAVGVVLAELLMGRRLFSAPADLDVLLKVRDVKLDRLDKYGADLPTALDRIVRKALTKSPRERFGSAAEFRDELADYLFASGQRIGPSDLRAFTGKLFDTSPEAAARLLQEARRMETPRTGRQAGGGGSGRRSARGRAGRPRRRGARRGDAVPADSDAGLGRGVGRAHRGDRGGGEPRGAGPRRRSTARTLVAARLHARVEARRAPPRRRRRCGRGCGGRAGHAQRRRTLRLGGAQASARQRGRRQHHHADAPVLRSRARRRDRPAALRARRRAEGDLPGRAARPSR